MDVYKRVSVISPKEQTTLIIYQKRNKQLLSDKTPESLKLYINKLKACSQ